MVHPRVYDVRFESGKKREKAYGSRCIARRAQVRGIDRYSGLAEFFADGTYWS